MLTEGPYDDGYTACPCFWGSRPARLVRRAAELLGTGTALDVGCGDGKNANYPSGIGFGVVAFDISSKAIRNATNSWPATRAVRWSVADIVTYDWDHAVYDLVVATGSLHCLRTADEVTEAIGNMKVATRPGGYNVVSVFNDRLQDLSGHAPSFKPVLLPHTFFVDAFRDWERVEVSDKDLLDSHPHRAILHRHSITRLLVRKPG